ncbi:hypothetical protein HOM50_04145 [bacterium]|nr:hypothetical protein [bacterium]MBT5015569.1 hypothetical protein [bacterium]
MKKILALMLFVLGSQLCNETILAESNMGLKEIHQMRQQDLKQQLENLTKESEKSPLDPNPLILAMEKGYSPQLVSIYLEAVGLGKDSVGHIDDKFDRWVPSYLASTLKKGGLEETVYRAIKYAIKENKTEWVEELLKAPRLKRVQESNLKSGYKTFLMEAALTNNLSMVLLLLNNGENPNASLETRSVGEPVSRVALDMATNTDVVAALKPVTSKKWWQFIRKS